MKITLPVSGREMTFSEEELTAILETYFKTPFRELKARKNSINKTDELVQNSEVERRTEVNPSSIKWKLFEKKRDEDDRQQIEVRKLILDAREQVEKYPEEYNLIAEIRVLKKTWTGRKTADELRQYAIKSGDLANWVWQALEWAQRICDGNGSEEVWESICNNADKNNWHRMIIDKNGLPRVLGGARACNDKRPEPYNICNSYGFHENFEDTVPLAVKKLSTDLVK